MIVPAKIFIIVAALILFVCAAIIRGFSRDWPGCMEAAGLALLTFALGLMA
mgnify:FL=1